MANKETETCEKFKTMIGGQALIEGIMMRGPEKDAVVIRGKDGLTVEVSPRKLNPPGSWKNWPFIRGIFNFFDAQIVGVKALLRSADLAPDEMQEEPSKFDKWLEEKLGDNLMKVLGGVAVVLGVALAAVLFIFIPTGLSSLLKPLLGAGIGLSLIEGLIKVIILVGYMWLSSRMKEIHRVFEYHGAEHKSIACYEAGLPLTVENIRPQRRFHPRCGTSFLFLVVFISIIVGSFISWDNPAIRMLLKLALIPVVVGISYELIKLAGRSDGILTRIISAPGMWLQRITTCEPDDSQIECAIAALEAVIPEDENADRW